MRKRRTESRSLAENRDANVRPPKKRSFLRLGLVVLALTAAGVWLAWIRHDAIDDANLVFIEGRLLNEKIQQIPPNVWVEIASEKSGWTRQGHAGLAFDSKRGTLLIFGSDSHGENWDNTVHEFNPLTLRWTTHYAPSPPETYRADEQGIAVAGTDGTFPWAMHSYDNIAYSPPLDALIVSSKKDHTPSPNPEAGKARVNPTWIYHLDSHRWEILRNRDQNTPSFFAAGSTYDPYSGNIAAYQYGQLWLLDPASRQWKRAPGKHHTDLGIHFTMSTDIQRRQFVFFGTGSGAIWVYTMPALPDDEGHWEKKQPSGDPCPKDQHFPVAYDANQGLFLLLPDENAERSITLVYFPDENRYLRVPGTEMPPQGMNYMMEYDPYHRVFLLVTGNWKTSVKVWAFRLDPNTLPRS